MATKEKSMMDGRLFKIDEVLQFDSEAGKRTLIYETDKTSAVIWGIEPGQTCFNHSHSKADDFWICIQGTGVFYPGNGEEVEIKKGDMIISRAGEHHGMKNTGDERFIFIGVAGPMPMDVIRY
ncbi:cupin [Bacillus sp. FJAT-27225]|nr:cupin [Bacillus sp. FJAT-27225]